MSKAELDRAALGLPLRQADPDTFRHEPPAMTDKSGDVGASQVHILRHSLGLTNGEEMYRNHFVTGEGSTDHPDCMALVEAGLMTRRSGNALTGDMDTFS